MTIQKTITLYQFDELPTEKAKEAARDWYRGAIDASDMAHTIEDFETIAGLLGVTIQPQPYKTIGGATRYEPAVSWELHVQGAGASFDGAWLCDPEAPAKLREYAPRDAELARIAEVLAAYPGVSATCATDGRVSHSTAAQVSVFDADDNEVTDDPSGQAIAAALRDLMDWLYQALDTEWDYQSSDEAIEDNIRANEYYFTAGGRRCNP